MFVKLTFESLLLHFWVTPLNAYLFHSYIYLFFNKLVHYSFIYSIYLFMYLSYVFILLFVNVFYSYRFVVAWSWETISFIHFRYDKNAIFLRDYDYNMIWVLVLHSYGNDFILLLIKLFTHQFLFICFLIN